MNEWDRDNLEFIKGCDSGEFDDWMDQATNDDIEYALELGLDYVGVLKEFSKIKANHYHLGGENMEKRESHLSFADSTLDLNVIFKILPKKAEITLEVANDKTSLLEDLKVVGRV